MKLPVIPYIFDWHHTKNVNEPYWKHLVWCFYAAGIYALLLPIALIHGLFPFLLPDAPDYILVNFLRKFRERREKTGQAEKRPE